MSDNSDTSISPIIHKGKRKSAILTDSESESDSSTSGITLRRRNGKRKNQIRETDSDSSVDKPRKKKRPPRVTDSEGSSDESEIVRSKARVVNSSSNVISESDSEFSGASDNGFEDNSSDEWESDWISGSELEEEPQSSKAEKKVEPESVATTSVTAACGHFSDSSDGESEKCPICLLSFNTQEVGTPETCDHSFCADCIQEWSKNVNTCPVDRQTFTLILVRKRYNGKVIRSVPVDVRRPSVDELIQEDPTYCEICGMSDREDRLLLCDGCDLGYHLDCLVPPMDTVPVEEWFCTMCRGPSTMRDLTRREDVSERRPRAEPRLLPRTSQSERIRATIETNRSSALSADVHSLSSGFEDVAVPGTSRSGSNSTARSRSRSTAANTTTRRKVKKRRKTKRRKNKRPTIVYEICEATGEKIAIKKKSKYRRKRKYKRKHRRVVQPKTVKTRLACQLGMCPPKKAGLAIPEVKVKANLSSIGLQRSQAGIPTLHLFGQRDQLDYFSASDDDTPLEFGGASSAGGGVAVMSQVRADSAIRRTARRKAAILAPAPPATVNPCDILGSILDSQSKLHSRHSVISVGRDGTIHIENNKKSSEKNNNTLIKPSSEIVAPPSPVDITSSGADVETTQAPMFPGRGGGNRQPYGFNRGGGGGYRGGDNRYDGGGSGYNHYQGGGPRGRGGYGPSMYNQRDNSNFGGYGNYHHHGGPPPFRGRGGPRFPMRRPQLQQHAPPPAPLPEPVELALEEPTEPNVAENTDQAHQQPEEDVDIYSDIETGSPVLDEEPAILKSATAEPEPAAPLQPALVSHAYNNSGSDDDSGSELVIDDTVKETDKYDPADPSADTDSNPSNIDVPKVEEAITAQPENVVEKLETPIEEITKPETSPEVATAAVPAIAQQTKLTNYSPQIVSQAVQQVLEEHLGAPVPQKSNEYDDEISDDDCPNSSIYSAASIDIAKSTEISVNIPKADNDPVQDNTNAVEDSGAKRKDSTVDTNEDGWGTGDEWDSCVETTDKVETSEVTAIADNVTDKQQDVISPEEEQKPAENPEEPIESPSHPVQDKSDEVAPETIEEEPKLDVKDDTEIASKSEDEENKVDTSEQDEECQTSDLKTDDNNDGDKSPKPDGISISDVTDDVEKSPNPNTHDELDNVVASVNEEQMDSSTPSLATSTVEQTDQEKLASPVKIAFDPTRKFQSHPPTADSNKKERVLQLYDDSDWEEWETKNDGEKPEKPAESITNEIGELEKMTEAISEEERSYTPCLDEKEPTKSQYSDDEANVGAGIGGMDTELISDEERNDIFDESHDMKTISDGDALEINAKESELDLTRPEDYEEGEIVEKLAAKKSQEAQPKETVPEDDKKKRPKKKPEKEPEKENVKSKENDKQSKQKPEFKKLSKSNKERNYRDKEKARSRSRDRKGKENKENRKDKRKDKKKDLERYSVRNLIADKPKKDQFGRDIGRSPSRSSRSATPSRRSTSRSRRSHSWDKTKKRRRRSRSQRRSRSRSQSRGYTPRSRSRGRSARRSRSLRRSRSPRRSRSRSFRRSRTPRGKRYRVGNRSASRERERYRNRSRRRSLDRARLKKKANRSTSRPRMRTRTPSPAKHRARGAAAAGSADWSRAEGRRHSYSREWTPSWSRSPSPRPLPRHAVPQSMSPSWTPPLAIEKGPVQPENLTVILTNNDVSKTKKKDKKKKGEKKSKDEFRKRKRTDRTPPPSKEVFASGDNILVSVSFNKTSEENTVATREVVGVKRKRDTILDIGGKKKKDKVNKEKKKRAKSPKTKKKNKEVANMKPVAIIDLDRSPFKELTPSPKDIIVLSDSDNCEKEEEAMLHHDMMQEDMMTMGSQVQEEEDSAPQSPTANYLNSTGPKTPPEPQIKFLLSSKQTQLRAITNPLHDPNDEGEVEIDPQEELEHRLEDVLHKGPNTPPEPPSSPPSSPDAYDPFDPTKSRSPTPEPATANQPITSAMNTPGDKTESDLDLADLAVGPLENSQKSTSSLNETGEKQSLDRAKRLSLSPERAATQTHTPPVSGADTQSTDTDAAKGDVTDKTGKSPERNSIGVVINQQVQPQFPAVVKPIIPTAVYSSVTPSIITSTPTVQNTTLPRSNLFNTSSAVGGTPRMVPASVPQRIILPTPAKSSPAKMSPLKSSPSKPPIKSTPIKPMPSKTMISKLPVPNVKPLTPIRKGTQSKAANRSVGQNGNEVIDVDLDFESPYSPGSSDYEDLFEPPAETTKSNAGSRGQGKNTTKSPAKQNPFDNLFGSSPVFRPQNNKTTKAKTNAGKVPIKMNKKSAPTKPGTNKTHVGVKIDEDNLKILDDLPNSAVEMQVKDKFLKKLNRQERVVEEVKLVLKPHYNKKHVTKEQYKDILRRAVPKICHNRSGEINPKKIQNLIEAYVRKARHGKKASAPNPGAPAPQPKP